MRSAVPVVLALATLAVAAYAMPLAGDETQSLVIVFKDGRQQTFSMADVARIEFRSPGTQSGLSGKGRFLGKWRVGDGAGGHFFIDLQPSGEATKSMGSGGRGTWAVVNGEARISWDDGWHDVIRKVGDTYQKVAFSPEKSFSDSPSNVADAQNTTPLPN